MFKKYPYKQKFRFLMIGAFLLSLICYRVSISKTINEYKDYKSRKMPGVQNATPVAFQMLQSKSRMLDGLLEKFVLDTVDENKNLLSIAGNYCNQTGIKLKEYKPIAAFRFDSMQILTRCLIVEGGFRQCLELVYGLETKFKTGRVSSVLFKSYTGPASSRTILNCSIHIQNIISADYEKK